MALWLREVAPAARVNHRVGFTQPRDQFNFYYLQANYHASSSFQDCVTHCKEKRGLMKSTKEFWSKKQFTDSSSMEQWMKTKQRIGEYTQYVL